MDYVSTRIMYVSAIVCFVCIFGVGWLVHVAFVVVLWLVDGSLRFV